MHTIKTILRSILPAMIGGLFLTTSAAAQTATTTTTLSTAIATTATRTVVLASATNVDVGGLLFIDREIMTVTAVNGTTITVMRGVPSSKVSQHPVSSLVYVAAKAQKASVFKTDQVTFGTCVRANEAFLPQVNPDTGDVFDCPVGATVWVPMNKVLTATSVQFNLDNGAGTTLDVELIRHPRPIVITACRIVYDDATAGTVAAGTASVGTTVGGVDIVAATNYENTKTVGATTAMTIVAGKIAAGTPVLIRHTGVAATQAGMSRVECDYIPR